MTNWDKLKMRIEQYEIYVEQLKFKKGLIAKAEYKKHRWFLNELKQIVEDIETGR